MKNLSDRTVSEAIRLRGGGGSQIQQIATHLRQMKVGDVAKRAAANDKDAIAAIKMIKQAATKAERY